MKTKRGCIPRVPLVLSKGRPVPGVVLFLCILCASCSSTKKSLQKNTSAESTKDRSEIQSTTFANNIITEKIDTIVRLKADTSILTYFVPWTYEDTTGYIQELETAAGKISVSIMPDKLPGNRSGKIITVTAIKKADSITVKLDRKIETNSIAHTQTKNDITTEKKVKTLDKSVDKKRTPTLWLYILLIICIVVVLYSKYKKYLPWKSF